MKEYLSTSAFHNSKGTVVTIGTFDGVHLGHKAILKRLVESALSEGLESVLLTFFPHPRMVLQKETDLKLLNTLSEKKARIASLGVDHLIIHPFTVEFSRLTAVEYVRDILVNQLHIKKIIIGYDHRFGRNRTANIQDLREYGRTYGFEVEEISAKELDDVAVSSTKIRNALLDGDIATANSFLGYPYTLHGTIVKGKGIGKTLGFPTANLKIDESYKLVPMNGVYLTQATVHTRKYYGVTSIGTNPTVGGKEKTIETYLMDVSEDLYDQPFALEFISWIREEHIFESIAKLKEAIAQDEQFARSFLEQYG